MPIHNDHITKDHFDEVVGKIHTKLNKLDLILEKLDWLMGKYKAHDEEHILLTNKVSEHSDNLEIVNEKLGVQL